MIGQLEVPNSANLNSVKYNIILSLNCGRRMRPDRKRQRYDSSIIFYCTADTLQLNHLRSLCTVFFTSDTPRADGNARISRYDSFDSGFLPTHPSDLLVRCTTIEWQCLLKVYSGPSILCGVILKY